jgi:hypothetical protein
LSAGSTPVDSVRLLKARVKYDAIRLALDRLRNAGPREQSFLPFQCFELVLDSEFGTHELHDSSHLNRFRLIHPSAACVRWASALSFAVHFWSGSWESRRTIEHEQNIECLDSGSSDRSVAADALLREEPDEGEDEEDEGEDEEHEGEDEEDAR